MNFSFCITTTYDDPEKITDVIQSIRDLKMPEYEILFIGDQNKSKQIGMLPPGDDILHILFDETEKTGWITKKKNILIDRAKYENVVMMHDYYVFDKDWYNNFMLFGNDWDVCTNAQLLLNGKRHFTDWVVWDDPVFPRYTSLHYDDWSRTRYMYISGGYFLLKKQVGIDNPFNENLVHGDAEDVEWSLRVRHKYVLKCNGKSIVKHNKRHRDCD